MKLHTRGVCLTSNNELMVVNGSSTADEKFSVFRYSMSGHYLGCITDGVKPESWGIHEGTIDGARKLFIVSKNTVSVFRWVET